MTDTQAIAVDELPQYMTQTGHPRGLYVLFFTEMWERFSYYGMRALLVFYMMKQLAFSQEWSSQVYGLYTGFVFFTPFFGGWIADRYWGQRKTVVWGGVIMAIGHFLMAFQSLFYPALLFLIIGNGLFKPNISTQVGSLYPEGDPRRDSAFSIFYVGINLGAFLSPLICGTLGEVYGWHYGFGAAGIGMILGLIVYIRGQKHLAPDNVMKRSSDGTLPKAEPLTREEWGRIWALLILCFFNIIFWGAYEQTGNTMALWVDTETNRNFFGWEMPASWYQSFNPAMIFAFTPLLTAYWAWQAKTKRSTSSAVKMGIGCMHQVISFVIMAFAAREHATSGSASSMLWLTVSTGFLTLGEIYLSPIGLSYVTKVSPIRIVSMMMGVWLLSSFFGNYMSGWLGTYWEKMSHENFFWLAAALSFAAGLGIFISLSPLKRLVGHDPEAAEHG